MQAKTMGEFSREEFLHGLRKMETNTIDELRAALPRLRSNLRAPGFFKNFYSFGLRGQCFLTQIALLPSQFTDLHAKLGNVHFPKKPRSRSGVSSLPDTRTRP